MSISNITFTGSVDSSYKRGKDKTKRKSRGLLVASGLAGAGIGAKIGGKLEQSNIFVKNANKRFNKRGVKISQIELRREALEEIENIRNYQPPKNASQLLNKVLRRKNKMINLLNKARLKGGIKGAAIGTGLSLSTLYLKNKLKNKDKN